MEVTRPLGKDGVGGKKSGGRKEVEENGEGGEWRGSAADAKRAAAE